MSLERAAAASLWLFFCLLPASAQWDAPTAGRDRRSHAERPGDLFPDAPDDVDGERPHSVFERLERTTARASRIRPDSEPAGAPGTVSVSELRHPLSSAEASLIQQAQQYSAAGKHAKAIQVLKNALQDSASMGYARSLLGIEYLKIGDIYTAIPELKEAVARLPRLAANHSNLGYALCRIGDKTNGEQELRAAIKLDGNVPKAHFLLGILLLDRGTEEARNHLLLAQNDVSRARLALAVFYARRGESGAAQEELVRYLQLDNSVDST
jgi:tetratricopeptide (TPR) repeat protein